MTTESGLPLTILVSELLANDDATWTAIRFGGRTPRRRCAPQHGTLSLADTRLIYTPDLGYQGGDEFAYLATDGAEFS